MTSTRPGSRPTTEGQSDPARHVVVRDLIAGLAAESSSVRLVPLDAWHTSAGYDDDRDIRPDGVHWTPEVSQSISEDYLGEQVVRAALGLPFDGVTS